MAKHGKNYLEKKSLVKEELYSLSEAVKLAKETSPVKFDATVEVHANMNLDPRHADQNIRATVSLPNGTGKAVKIAVFANEADQKKALAAGADKVGEDDLIEEVSKGKIDFDVAIATPELMKKMGKIAKVLGPQGLMPNPKAGTVAEDVEKAVGELKKGKIEYRCDKAGIIHVGIGKVSFEEKKLLENAQAFFNSLKENKPSGVKGKYYNSITIVTTMGPGIQINPQSLQD